MEKRSDSLEEFYRILGGAVTDIKVLYNDQEKSLRLYGESARGIMVASTFEGSPASNASLPAKSVISQINDIDIMNLEGFRKQMNTTHPDQIIAITTGDGKIYQINLTMKEGGIGFMGIGISGNAVYSSGASFQQAPAKQFLQVLKAIPSNGLQGFTYMLSSALCRNSGLYPKGFPRF